MGKIYGGDKEIKGIGNFENLNKSKYPEELTKRLVLVEESTEGKFSKDIPDMDKRFMPKPFSTEKDKTF